MYTSYEFTSEYLGSHLGLFWTIHCMKENKAEVQLFLMKHYMIPVSPRKKKKKASFTQPTIIRCPKTRRVISEWSDLGQNRWGGGKKEIHVIVFNSVTFIIRASVWSLVVRSLGLRFVLRAPRWSFVFRAPIRGWRWRTMPGFVLGTVRAAPLALVVRLLGIRLRLRPSFLHRPLAARFVLFRIGWTTRLSVRFAVGGDAFPVSFIVGSWAAVPIPVTRKTTGTD